jgi:hypothetical protein
MIRGLGLILTDALKKQRIAEPERNDKFPIIAAGTECIVPEGSEKIALSGLKYGLYYESSGDGNSGLRPITLRSFFYYSPKSEYYIAGHCHIRKAHRTFKVSEIKHLIDLSSGEVFDSPLEHLLANYEFKEKAEWSEKRILTKEQAEDIIYKSLVSVHQYDLQILTFIAWCDSDFSDSEKRIALQFIQDAYRDTENLTLKKRLKNIECPRFLPPSVEEKLYAFINRINPDSLSYVEAYQIVSADERRLQRVMKYASRLAESDENLTEEEMTLLVQLKTD